MKRYAIAYTLPDDAAINLHVVQAYNLVQALHQVIPDFTFAGPENTTLQDLQPDLAELDIIVEVVEIV